MVGGTFGVAAIGALFQGLTRGDVQNKLDFVPAEPARAARRGGRVSRDRRHRAADGSWAARQIVATVEESFIHALSTAMWLSLGVALVGALVAALLIDRRGAGGGRERAADRRACRRLAGITAARYRHRIRRR